MFSLFLPAMKTNDSAKKPPVPLPGSYTVSPICGATTRTTARMISRGVKNCPPSLPFSPIFSSKPS